MRILAEEAKGVTDEHIDSIPWDWAAGTSEQQKRTDLGLVRDLVLTYLGALAALDFDRTKFETRKELQHLEILVQSARAWESNDAAKVSDPDGYARERLARYRKVLYVARANIHAGASKATYRVLQSGYPALQPRAVAAYDALQPGNNAKDDNKLNLVIQKLLAEKPYTIAQRTQALRVPKPLNMDFLNPFVDPSAFRPDASAEFEQETDFSAGQEEADSDTESVGSAGTVGRVERAGSQLLEDLYDPANPEQPSVPDPRTLEGAERETAFEKVLSTLDLENVRPEARDRVARNVETLATQTTAVVTRDAPWWQRAGAAVFRAIGVTSDNIRRLAGAASNARAAVRDWRARQGLPALVARPAPDVLPERPVQGGPKSAPEAVSKVDWVVQLKQEQESGLDALLSVAVDFRPRANAKFPDWRDALYARAYIMRAAVDGGESEFSEGFARAKTKWPGAAESVPAR